MELLDENRATAEPVIRLNGDLRQGGTETVEVIARLKVRARLGVTRGTLAAAERWGDWKEIAP